MAVLVRTRRLSNPGKKRLSLKQKLHFGTARQRAAARLSLKGKRRVNPSIRKTKKAYKKLYSKTHNKPVKKIRLARLIGQGLQPRKKRRKNVGEIVSISLAGLTGNPGKRRRNTGMAKSKKRRLAGLKAARTRKRNRRTNPGVVTRRRRTYRHRATRAVARRTRRTRRSNPTFRIRRVSRRRNPGSGIGGITTGVLGKAVGIITGLLLPRYLTQLALGGNNTGYMGYAGNIAASIGVGWAAGKATKSKDFGTTVMIAGIASTILRYVSENTSYGSFIQASLAGVGKGGDMGLGIIQDSSFPVPQTFAPGSMTNAIVPRATRNFVNGAVSAQAAQMAQMSSAGAKGMGRVMMGRNPRRAIM